MGTAAKWGFAECGHQFLPLCAHSGGQIDTYQEFGLKLLDGAAAGSSAAREAGAKVAGSSLGERADQRILTAGCLCVCDPLAVLSLHSAAPKWLPSGEN